jgi:hypothetical protein
MFGTPARSVSSTGETVFTVDVNTTPLGVELDYTVDGLIYDKDVQPRFRTLQNLVLSELCKEKRLFKNPPTLSSLEAICPNWGFVSSGGRMMFSPYAKFLPSDIGSEKIPCLVDIQLKAIEITRSTIRPLFKVHYLGKKEAAIDLDWSAPTSFANDDIQEVSDVPSAVSGIITLADPVARAREKMAAKAQVQEALTAAQEARAAAKKMAHEFYETYDLSDSESAFTEWLSESDSESESD